MRFDGESTVFSYENDGGISLFSVEPPDGAITGGSGTPEEGAGATSTRIRWWITDEGNGIYDGGITGVGWFRITDLEHPNTSGYEGPFEDYTDKQIYDTAVASGGSLNSIFNEWNEAHGKVGDLTITSFILFLQSNPDTIGCVVPGGASG